VRAARTSIVVLLIAAAPASCGSSEDEPPGLTSRQAQGLVAELEAARSTAAAGDVARTKEAMGKFRRSVIRLRRAGALDDATARSLRIGASRVLRRVESDSAPPAQPAPSTQTEATPAPEAEAEPSGEKKRGKGNKKQGKKK
jgi:hypothetical protein